MMMVSRDFARSYEGKSLVKTEPLTPEHLGTGKLTECQLPGCWCHVAFVECKGKVSTGKPCKAINHG